MQAQCALTTSPAHTEERTLNGVRSSSTRERRAGGARRHTPQQWHMRRNEGLYTTCVVVAMMVGESGWWVGVRTMRCKDDVQVRVRSETNSEMHYDDGPGAATTSVDVDATPRATRASSDLRVVHAAHGDRRRLPVGVVRMRDRTGRGHHHRVRHGMLHCSDMSVSHQRLSCWHQVIGNWRTLRALVVVVGVCVGGNRGRRHRWTGTSAIWWRGVRARWRRWGHTVGLRS